MSTLTRRDCLRVIAAFTCAALPSSRAWAAWPERPVTLVVGYPPGGGSDTSARIVSSRMAAKLGQNVIVENRPGSAGQIAAGFVARSPADGYTALIDASSFTINLALYPALPYAAQSFATVGVIAHFPLIVVANPKFPPNSMTELIAFAKKGNAGSVFYASAGNGSIQQILGSLLAQKASIELTHVPYKGAGAALNDVIGGQLPLFFANAAVALPHLRAGTLKALAVTGRVRMPALPDIPTLAEVGLGDVDLREWIAMYVPAATPAAVTERLAEALQQTLAEEEVRRSISALSGEAFAGTRAEAAKFVESEIARMRNVVRERGIKGD